LASKKGIEPYKQNYNLVFKSSIDLFKGKSLDFFGIGGTRKVTGILDIDQPVAFNQTDKAFICDDDLSIHMEEESEISMADLKRFLYSHCWYLHHGRHDCVITVIVTNKKPRASVFEDMSVSFNPLVVDLSDRDFEEAFDRLESHIDAGEEFNELELVYAPLYKSSKGLNVEDKLRMTTELVRRAKAGKHPSAEKIFALTVVLCGKFIPKATYNELWEELTVRFEEVPIIQVAEAKGAEKLSIALADAQDLIKQGFSEEEIASRTGLDIEVVKEQAQFARDSQVMIADAQDLIKKGFSEEEIASRTGLDIEVVKEQAQFARDSQVKIAEAQDLIKKGFSEEEIASRTGLDIEVVKEQAQFARDYQDSFKAKVLRAKELVKQGLGDEEIALDTGLAVNEVQLFAR
jgi:DNA/RNA endonuclease YhcR with UshA esterase domain